MERIKQLEGFLEEDPNDPFNYYALALEYLKTNPAGAYTLFEKLITKFPEYLPTYYPFAQLLADRKEISRAESVYETGMAKAKSLGDMKTHRELRAAYDDWVFQRE